MVDSEEGRHQKCQIQMGYVDHLHIHLQDTREDLLGGSLCEDQFDNQMIE